MRSVPTRGIVKPIEEMYAAMSADNDSSARSRIHYIEETVSVFEHRFNHREIVDTQAMVKSWLSIAGDREAPEAVRISAIHKGVTPVLALLGNTVHRHKADAENTLSDNFGTCARDCVAKFMAVLPAPQATMDALLFVAEGKGQASAPVRLAALTGYMMARVQYSRMCDYVESEQHAGRALKLAQEFPHAQNIHSRLMVDIG